MDGRKVLTVRRNGSGLLAECESNIITPPLQPILPPAAPRRSHQIVIEHFGNAVVDLLACTRCFVSTVARSGVVVEQICVGDAPVRLPATIDKLICTRLSRNAPFPVLRPDDPVARNLIGHENGHGGHSVVGQLRASDGSDIVFAAGWRQAPFLEAEIGWLTRAVSVIWSTAESLLHPQASPSGIRVFLEQLVSPAFVVDEGLHLHDVNSLGRRLLVEGKLLRANHGLLAGANAPITERLKSAVRQATQSQFNRGWTNATIPLSVEGQRFAFAWVGALPIPHDPDQMLVLVPRVDAVAGARRIAMAFGLNSADEKIVARILYGHCPRRIAAELHLTEATIRTYTKRIMLKLGINRQSELFLLHILTMSPFRTGLCETAMPAAMAGWKRAC